MLCVKGEVGPLGGKFVERFIVTQERVRACVVPKANKTKFFTKCFQKIFKSARNIYSFHDEIIVFVTIISSTSSTSTGQQHPLQT